jgi:hypothetical protein
MALNRARTNPAPIRRAQSRAIGGAGDGAGSGGADDGAGSFRAIFNHLARAHLSTRSKSTSSNKNK